MRLNSLTASFAGFRTLTFRDGLNIVVADRAKEATKTDSRNGLGKTTVIALIDFCLGANMSTRLEQMKGNGWYFDLSVTTRSGNTLRASRSPDTPSSIHVSGNAVAEGLAESTDRSPTGGFEIGVRRWTAWLSEECFVREGMPAVPPSFRSLVRHFARYRTDSLIDPFRTLANQGAEAVQAENSYLLGLDWRFAREWSELKERKSRIALVDDPEQSIEARVAALEPKLARLQSRAERLAADITAFAVLPEYREVEARVQLTTNRLKALGNDNFTDRQQLELYASQARNEFGSGSLDVQALFEEAGMLLGDLVVRSLEEAAEFQRQVAANRAAYLSEEARRVRERVAARETSQAKLAGQLDDDLRMLRTGGALDDFIAMQQQLAQSQVQVAQVEEQIKTLRDLADRKSRLKSDELDLVARTKLDVQERFPLRAALIARFGEIMELLYGEPADLRVTPGKSGVQFKVVLPRTGSGGVHLMAIFAYDIALSEDLARAGRGPGFLIHDSAIFADVDERQTARAIEIAAASAEQYSYQHLVTVNSDHVPWAEFSDREVFDEAIVLRLHDGSPDGGVLGQRLNFVVDGDDTQPI